jgi:hypothetical protein
VFDGGIEEEEEEEAKETSTRSFYDRGEEEG